MDIECEDNIVPMEECFVKMINNFVGTFHLLSKSDSQIESCIDTLNSVVMNILDVYKLCFLTRSNTFCCQNVITSLDGLKEVIKSIPFKENKESKEVVTSEKKAVYKVCPFNLQTQDQDLSTHTKKTDDNVDSGGNLLLSSESTFTFGDVNYEAIMNNLKKDNLDDNVLMKHLKENIVSKCFSDASTQTHMSMSNLSNCSKGTQVDSVKNGPSHHSLNNFNPDYILNESYYNIDETYQNQHYYEDTCSYQNSVERSYQEHLTNFSHQYQQIPCGSLPLPGRNITAPMFLPRLMSPSPLHNVEHHVPYTIAMLSSNHSYIPGTFGTSVGSPQFLTSSSLNYKENKKSHRKSEISATKKNKSFSSKPKDPSKNQKKGKHVAVLEAGGCVKSFLQSTCYLAKIDLLEKACEFDMDKSNPNININENVEEDKKLENENNSDNDLEIKYKFSSVPSDKDLCDSNIDKSNDAQTNSVTQQNERDESDEEDNSNSMLRHKIITTKSLVNSFECSKKEDIDKMTSGQSHARDELSVVASLETLNNDLDDHTDITKKMDVKLSFVNVLTSGLKVTSDKIASLKESDASGSNLAECDKDSPINTPDVFELSNFPTLKPSSHEPISDSETALYFGRCKSQLSCVFSASDKPVKANSLFSSNPSITRGNNDKVKETEPLKKIKSDGFKTLPLKKNLSFSNYKKHPDIKNHKVGFNFMKYSNVTNPRSIKDELNSSQSSMDKKMENSPYPMNRKSKSEEAYQQKRSNSFNKRKSIPGEDGWTIIPVKLRNNDPWSNKDNSNKKNNSSQLINNCDDSTTQKAKIDEESIQISSNPENRIYPLQNYFNSVQVNCQPFFENGGIINSFNLSSEMTGNERDSYAMPSISIIDGIGGNSVLERNSSDKCIDDLAHSDFLIPSTSLVNLKSCSEIIDNPDSSLDYTQIDFLDKHCLIEDKDSLISHDKLGLFENSQIMSSELNILSKWPSYEGSEIASFLSHSSCWSEIFKPESDSDDQHLNDEDKHLNEEDQRKSRELQEEAIMLRKKITDLQFNENEIDTENEAEFEGDNQENIDPHEIFTEYSHYLSQISWGDQIDEMERFQEMLSSDPEDSIFKFQYGSIEQFKELVARHPGKALDLHCKLLGRSKRSNSDELNEIRRKKAEEKRQRLLNRKASKMRELLQRVEEVRQAQIQINEERKCRIDFKLRKAEENRNLHLKTIQKKAHDEEEKLKEIAFINELEAQNRRHDSLALRQEQEERLQNIMEERQRKVDEKAAKEAAVGERKRVLEAERMEKIEKIQQKRREKEENIGKKQFEREQERLVTAREKAREREERLLAIQAAQIANVEELQKKIKIKQENMARRHEENIQHIRQKAVETAMLRNILAEDSNSDLSSKSSLSSEKKKMGHVTSYTVAEDSLCTKHQKKKCKKIRSRLQKNGAQFVSQCHVNKEEGSKVNSNLKSVIDVVSKLADNNELFSEFGFLKLEKQMSKINNIVSNNLPETKQSFRTTGCFEVCQRIILHLLRPDIIRFSASCRSLERLVEILNKVCENDYNNMEYFISCNYTCDIIDSITLLVSELLCSERDTNNHISRIIGILLGFLEKLLRSCNKSNNTEVKSISKRLINQLKDIASYCYHCGLLRKLSDVIKLASLDKEECRIEDTLIESIVYFITTFIYPELFCADSEELLLTTDFMGTVSLLYSHLHQTQQSLPKFTLSIIIFFKVLASEQLSLFQKVLGSDGFCLQFRYISGYILQHCVTMGRQTPFTQLLNHTILVIGYFALKNHENQMILQSGQTPTVLQQLIDLPIQYFCNPKLKCILFPTLIAICDSNAMCKESLENEMSYEYMENFLKDPLSRDSELMKTLQ